MHEQDLKLLKRIFLTPAECLAGNNVFQTEDEECIFCDKQGALMIGSRQKFYRSYEYINNPDGSIRWMWPSGNKAPDFLKFYTATSIRTYFSSLAMRVLFYLPVLRKTFIKEFVVGSDQELFIDNLLNKNSDYSIFTGTVGPNRKIVVYKKSNDQSEFIKIPYGEQSFESLRNEYTNAQQFKPHSDILETPSLKYENNILTSSDLEINTVKKVSLELSTQRVLVELVNRTISKDKLYKDLIEAPQPTDKEELQGLYKVLFNAYDCRQNTKVYCSLNHGDFTPWNCYQEDEELKIYDLEFASHNLPVYYDVLHFWVQYLIMCTDKSFEEIYKQTSEYWEYSLFSTHAAEFFLEFDEVWNNYLLFMGSHYYSVYSKQEKLHHQGKKLIQFLTTFL